MTLNWWTLGIQTVNVVILIWLLGRFFWRPVAAMIEQRRAAAQRIVAEAEAKRREAPAACLAEAEQEARSLEAATRATIEKERQAVDKAWAERASRLAVDIAGH